MFTDKPNRALEYEEPNSKPVFVPPPRESKQREPSGIKPDARVIELVIGSPYETPILDRLL